MPITIRYIIEWHVYYVHNIFRKVCLYRGKWQEERQKEEGQAIVWSFVTCLRHAVCHVSVNSKCYSCAKRCKAASKLCCVSWRVTFCVGLNALLCLHIHEVAASCRIFAVVPLQAARAMMNGFRFVCQHRLEQEMAVIDTFMFNPA